MCKSRSGSQTHASLSWPVTVSQMIPLDEGQPSSDDSTMAAQPPLSRQTSRTSLSSPYGPSRMSKRKATTFVLTTSDGRAYLARWSPPAEDVVGGGSQDNLGQHSAAASAASLWSPTGNAPSQANYSVPDQSRWTWTGVCFHPPVPTQEVVEEYEQLQEQALDRGKGASAVDVNSAMDLVAIGCEESVPSRSSVSRCGSADPLHLQRNHLCLFSSCAGNFAASVNLQNPSGRFRLSRPLS